VSVHKRRKGKGKEKVREVISPSTEG